MPPFLKPGDTIGILSTARHIPIEAVAPVKTYFEEQGFRVVLGRSIGTQWHQFAGNDEERLADLQAMLDQPDIHAILTAKGGYGTIRILDNIDWTGFKKHPKWITGFSDVTILHAHLNEQLGIQSIHGPLANLSEASPERWEAIHSLHAALTGQFKQITVNYHPFNKVGVGKGIVTGGNLSILYSLLGCPEAFDPIGKILLLEEVDEYLYHLDRMLWSLRRAHKLEGLAGIIIGGMSEIKDHQVPFGYSAEGLLKNHLQAFPGPVAFGFPVGHIPYNQSCFLGTEAKLAVNENRAVLTY